VAGEALAALDDKTGMVSVVAAPNRRRSMIDLNAPSGGFPETSDRALERELVDTEESVDSVTLMPEMSAMPLVCGDARSGESASLMLIGLVNGDGPERRPDDEDEAKLTVACRNKRCTGLEAAPLTAENSLLRPLIPLAPLSGMLDHGSLGIFITVGVLDMAGD
jgi:hypothetical protein